MLPFLSAKNYKSCKEEIIHIFCRRYAHSGKIYWIEIVYNQFLCPTEKKKINNSRNLLTNQCGSETIADYTNRILDVCNHANIPAEEISLGDRQSPDYPTLLPRLNSQTDLAWIGAIKETQPPFPVEAVSARRRANRGWNWLTDARPRHAQAARNARRVCSFRHDPLGSFRVGNEKIAQKICRFGWIWGVLIILRASEKFAPCGVQTRVQRHGFLLEQRNSAYNHLANVFLLSSPHYFLPFQ